MVRHHRCLRRSEAQPFIFLKSARQVEALSRGARGSSAPTWWMMRSPSAVSGTLSSAYASQLRGWDLMKGRRTAQAVLRLPMRSHVYLTQSRIAAVIRFPRQIDATVRRPMADIHPWPHFARRHGGRRGASGEVLHALGARRRLRRRGFRRRLVGTPAGKTNEDWMTANRLHQHRRSANKKRALREAPTIYGAVASSRYSRLRMSKDIENLILVRLTGLTPDTLVCSPPALQWIPSCVAASYLLCVSPGDHWKSRFPMARTRRNGGSNPEPARHFCGAIRATAECCRTSRDRIICHSPLSASRPSRRPARL